MYFSQNGWNQDYQENLRNQKKEKERSGSDTPPIGVPLFIFFENN
jgi:hypothetical protein